MVVLVFLLNGCTTLVRDDVRQPIANAEHCSGAEWADNSSLAVLPIPVVAFLVPHVDIHDIKGDDHLKRCGILYEWLIDKSKSTASPACRPH